MNIKDLMVGDWVTNRPLDEEPFNIQWERVDFAQGYYEAQFTPIRITDEELVNNFIVEKIKIENNTKIPIVFTKKCRNFFYI